MSVSCCAVHYTGKTVIVTEELNTHICFHASFDKLEALVIVLQLL